MLEYLALFPVIHFIVLFIVSKINNTSKFLYNIYAIMYLDWLFIPFNYLIPLAVKFSWILFGVVLIVSVLASWFIHIQWHKANTGSEKNSGQANYLINKTGLTSEGWVHFVFMVVQASLVATVLLSAPISIYYIYMMLCLLVYVIGYIVVIKYVRLAKFNSKAEISFLIFGLAVIILRIILYFTM